jgi:flagellar biosynthesis regulator FlbT
LGVGGVVYFIILMLIEKLSHRNIFSKIFDKELPYIQKFKDEDVVREQREVEQTPKE